MVHIITHNDLDGYSAGYIVKSKFSDLNTIIQHYNYDRDVDLSGISNGDTVIITDYSLTNEEYHKILDIIGTDGHLIWLDHHITAINRYKEDETLNLEGIHSTKLCGAALAYLYFEEAITQEELDNAETENLISLLPYWLTLVDAWDTWKLDSPVRNNAEALCMGISNNLSIDEIDRIANNSDTLFYYIDKGFTYMEYQQSWCKNFREKYMFTRKMSGYLFNVNRDIEAAILNIGCASSKYFGDEINNYDVCITQCFNGEKWIVSFYSDKPDIDCSYAAKAFGGGGHKGAAGCSFNQVQPPISQGNTEIIKKGENLRWQSLKTKMEKN